MILFGSIVLSLAIIITAAIWPVPYRINRKLPKLPERRRRPF